MSKTEYARNYDPDADTIIEARDVSVTFEMERGGARVLRDVSIDIERQEILGIAGESGSGKSMFASVLLDAVVDPGVTDGDIRFHSEDGKSTSVLDLTQNELEAFRWEKISMVFQGALSSFNPTLSLRGHFLETLDAHDKDRREGMERAYDLLSELYLDPERVLNSYPHELSGGMKQRALIALSLILEPEVLVLDEPTASLDLLMQRSILTLLEDLQEKYELTLVFITHDLALLTKVADRLAILYAFQFIEVGETDNILYNAAHPYTRLLLKSTPDVGVPVDEMSPIEGLSPDPVDMLSGCSFASRCPLAEEECHAEAPGMQSIGETHEAACFYWEDANEAVPNTWMEESR